MLEKQQLGFSILGTTSEIIQGHWGSLEESLLPTVISDSKLLVIDKPSFKSCTSYLKVVH